MRNTHFNDKARSKYYNCHSRRGAAYKNNNKYLPVNLVACGSQIQQLLDLAWFHLLVIHRDNNSMKLDTCA